MASAPKPFPFAIDRRLCKQCGICISFCPTGVYESELDGSPVISYPEKCIECMLCLLRCPDFAISLEAGS